MERFKLYRKQRMAYVCLRKRDRKYLIVKWWTHTYGAPRG